MVRVKEMKEKGNPARKERSLSRLEVSSRKVTRTPQKTKTHR